jgi:uncharacterized membrane protein
MAQGPPPQLAGRVRRGLLVAVAGTAFAWFFVAAMVGGFWLMPGGVALTAFVLSASLPLDRWRFVRALCLGLVAGLTLDLMVRGVPILLISRRWDWLSEVFFSTLLGGVAAILGGVSGTLAGRLFRSRST